MNLPLRSSADLIAEGGASGGGASGVGASGDGYQASHVLVFATHGASRSPHTTHPAAADAAATMLLASGLRRELSAGAVREALAERLGVIWARAAPPYAVLQRLRRLCAGRTPCETHLEVACAGGA